MKNYTHFILFLFSMLTGCRPSDPKKDPLLSIPDPKTLNESYISDKDGILSVGTVQYLNPLLSKLDQSGRAHIDVVMVKSIGDMVPKDAATKLFNRWKIGSAKTDNGLLILMVIDQHRIEFETGYGLEGDLPDIICFKIQQEHMIAHAKKGDYDAAVKEGVNAVIEQLSSAGPQSAYDHSLSADTSASINVSPDGAVTVPDPGIEPGDSLASGSDLVYAEPMPVAGEYPVDDGKDSVIIIMVVMFIVYLILLLILNYKFSKGVYKYTLLNPAFIVMLLVPLGAAIWIYRTQDINRITRLQIAVLYLALLIYLHVHFLITGIRVSKNTKDDNRYQKYTKWNAAHHWLGWTAWLFPLPWLAIYWYRYFKKIDHLRNDPYICSQCNGFMHKIDEGNDDAYLDKGQKAEEKLKSVDYDVWECDHDKEHAHLIFNYKNLGTRAVVCPKCNYITLVNNGSEVIERATTSSTGWGYKYKKCRNCGHEIKEVYTIAKISTSSSGSSSSGSSSSGGSSSSSGGSSGGGGAGSSW